VRSECHFTEEHGDISYGRDVRQDQTFPDTADHVARFFNRANTFPVLEARRSSIISHNGIGHWNGGFEVSDDSVTIAQTALSGVVDRTTSHRTKTWGGPNER